MPPPHRPAGSADASPSGSDTESAPEEEFRRPAAASLEDAKLQRRMRLMESAGLSDSGEDAFDSGDDLSDDDAADGRHDSESDGGEAQEDSSDAGTSASEEDAVEDIPFEKLAARRAGGDSAGQAFAQGLGSSGSGKMRKGSRYGKGEKPHRENKNRPTEASSRKPVGRLRDVVQTPRIERKDPRFEELSGRYNPERFRKQYSFLYDEALPQERAAVKSMLKKVKGVEAKEALTTRAGQLDAALREDALRQKKRKFEAELKAKEREAVRAGKKPFFLKKTDRRKAELVAQYQDLQKSGGLDKFLAKRRRKNAAKDHRYVPAARAG
mmetsp:Transcript_4555/g.13100  ORF Transcript_4555/g.13100 Transcript_4555/m.13100 type:complete len:325 (-) Transcript_4555:426-1400(-)|eukprot:CAMPEP_0206142016 /NCGR_PEP_ID=MMETSP1473-20131121/15150_1 /ASSEMBLY_ACC=CAM_ASM_001109 /TAXON_ID=1461547 /ORGANISM="Stichococcus sp, Strain RCC1054" /LENGTH=324 /DNA_ID=CAMNT_0053536823 /DNA_START=571 /DNA_END=1545 /DNA_ORIENTATION=-